MVQVCCGFDGCDVDLLDRVRGVRSIFVGLYFFYVDGCVYWFVGLFGVLVLLILENFEFFRI